MSGDVDPPRVAEVWKARTFRHGVVLSGLLSAGVVINLTVTWGIAFLVTDVSAAKPRGFGASGPSHPVWQWDDSRSFGVTCIQARVNVAPAPSDPAGSRLDSFYHSSESRTLPKWVRLGEPGNYDHRHEVWGVAFGWPIRAMYYEWHVPHGIWSLSSILHGIELYPNAGVTNGGLPYYTPRALPTGVIWVGFVANTLLFAASLGIVPCLAIAAKHRYRLVRNRCPYCGYPSGISSVCTECGRQQARKTDPPAGIRN